MSEKIENLGELVARRAYAPDSKFCIKTRKWMFTTYPNCCLGNELIDFIVLEKIVEDEKSARALAEQMISDKQIRVFSGESSIINNNYYQLRKVKVCILGSGYAGMILALELQRIEHYDVTLVTRDSVWTFPPQIPLFFELKEIWKKNFSDLLKTIKLVRGEIEIGDPKFVEMKDKARIEGFDYLVIATGSYYEDIQVKDSNIPIIKGNDPLAMETSLDLIKSAKKITVIGSGTVGCEIMGPITEFNPDKKVTMISSSKNVIARRIEPIWKPIQDHLSSPSNAEIKFGQKVLTIEGNKVVTDKEEVETDLVFLCTGFKPSTNFMKSNMSSCLDKSGYIMVNACMQVEGHSNIFAAGDVVNTAEEKLGQCAAEHAKLIVENLSHILERSPLKKYVPGPRGYAIYLGSVGSLAFGERQVWFGKTVSYGKKWGYKKLFAEIHA